MQKTILITGGGRGIGAATARLLALQGHAICINYASNQATALAVVKDIQAAGGQAWCMAADVSQADQVQALFSFVDRECPPLHALVNNAGIVAPYARVEGMDVARARAAPKKWPRPSLGWCLTRLHIPRARWWTSRVGCERFINSSIESGTQVLRHARFRTLMTIPEWRGYLIWVIRTGTCPGENIKRLDI